MSIQVTPPSPEDVRQLVDVLLKIKSYYDVFKTAKKFCGRAIKKIRDMVSKKYKKILLIGGGEIGTEIAIAAVRNNWKVRAVIKEKPSPIINLPYYLFSLSLTSEPTLRVEDFEIKRPEVNVGALFQYRSFPNFRGDERLQDIAHFISLEEPDVVLLEDIFLTPEEWNTLYQYTMERIKENKPAKQGIVFIPSPVDEITVYEKKFYVSDIFLNKAVMKRFLATIGLKQHLLELWDKNDLILIDIEKLEKELERNADLGTEVAKIKRALEDSSRIILKPLSTSSGHGQFAISDIKELRQKISLLKYLRYRVPNKFLMVERYIENPIEFCVIVGRKEDGHVILCGDIYYEKYNPDECLDKGFEGQSRLMIARTYEKRKSVEHLFMRLIPDIVKKILNFLPVPFLYIEFILDPKNDEVYINEISYRPDDAGFVTLASHELSQFDIFMKSINTLLLKGIKKFHKKEPCFVFLKKMGNWVCATLIEYEKCEIPKPYITYETDEGRVEDHFKFRFYEKALAKNEATYRRIIGYQWHHQAQEEKDEGERILRMHAKDLGIPPDLLERLIKALKRHMRRE